MDFSKHTINRTILATAVTAAIGTTTMPTQSEAANLIFSTEGWFTLVNAPGTSASNNVDAVVPPYFGVRTHVVGTLTFDTDTNSGSATIDPFSFFGSGTAKATSITFQDSAGTLMLGNMAFNWSATNGIPVSIAWDGAGLLDAIGMGLAVGTTIGSSGADLECGTDITCATPATDDFEFDFVGVGTYILPIGPSPVATTTFNTTTIGGADCTLGCNPSGTLPLTDDGIGGSPMPAGPFTGFNANFDLSRMTLISDGSGTITAPPPVDETAPEVPGPPKIQSVDLGVPTDVTPVDTAEYCTETIAVCDAGTGTDNWVADGTNGANNPIDVPITETVNESVVDWRAGDGVVFAPQAVKVTVTDTMPPDIDSVPKDVSVDIETTEPPTEVCFTDDGTSIGHLTASDVWTAEPTIEWSLNGLFPGNPNVPAGNCSSDFKVNENTVYWRVTDDAGNITDYDEQTVTLNLPEGIVGTDCVFDVPTPADRAACELDAGCDVNMFDRDITGRFIMRNTGGSQIGKTDTTITGRMDTTLLCDDEETCTLDGAAWETTQPFEGSLWKATPVRLFGENEIEPSWTFETCPGDDASINCDKPPPPRPLSMTSVGPGAGPNPGQLSAHMLFEWGSVKDIDVAVVWDVDCGSSMLTATDPDGDGVLGTKMVDGPFQGFNAAFDINTADGEPPFAEGGFTTLIPVFQSPIAGGSPPPLDFTPMDADDFPKDPVAIESCVGGCPDFMVAAPNLMEATDGGGTYKFTRVVLPLNEKIPFWSLLRKFKDGKWQDWVIDSRNVVKSAARNADGSCSEPGSGDYSIASFNSRMENKLEFEDGCLELTIEDNGLNDVDDDLGKIQDPPGVAQVPSPGLPDPETSDSNTPFGGSNSGGCSLSTAAIDPAKRADWTLMGGVLAVLGFFSLRRRRKQRN